MRQPDTLRPPSAGRLLAIFREVAAAEENETVRGLLCNANVLAESCFLGEERLFDSPAAVLDALTVREMEALLQRLAKEPASKPAGVNPQFDETRFQKMRRERT